VELDWVFMVMVIRGSSCTASLPPQAKLRALFRRGRQSPVVLQIRGVT
jgi:hypothetical protein